MIDSLIIITIVWIIFGSAGVMLIRRAYTRSRPQQENTLLSIVKNGIDYIVGVWFLVFVLIGMYFVISNIR